MKNGDLSNRASLTIAFRLEDFLLEREETDLKKMAKNLWRGNFKMSRLNLEVVHAINHIFRFTDMSAYLIKEEGTKLNDYEKEMLETVNYSRIVEIRKPVDITRCLMTGDYTYYVDRNLDRMSLVNHNKCISMIELNHIIRRG